MNEHGDFVRSSSHDYNAPFPSGWTWEKFAVVDAGDGLISLHSPKWNRFLSMNREGDSVWFLEWESLEFRLCCLLTELHF